MIHPVPVSLDDNAILIQKQTPAQLHPRFSSSPDQRFSSLNEDPASQSDSPPAFSTASALSTSATAISPDPSLMSTDDLDTTAVLPAPSSTSSSPSLLGIRTLSQIASPQSRRLTVQDIFKSPSFRSSPQLSPPRSPANAGFMALDDIPAFELDQPSSSAAGAALVNPDTFDDEEDMETEHEVNAHDWLALFARTPSHRDSPRPTPMSPSALKPRSPGMRPLRNRPGVRKALLGLKRRSFAPSPVFNVRFESIMMTIRTRYFVDPSTNEPLSVSPRDLEPLAKDLQLPPYLTSTLHAHLMHSTPSVSKLAWSSFDAGWRALCSEYGSDDPVALTFGILYRAGVATSGEKAHAALAVQKQFLIGSDFVGVVKEIMERHPGYDFLAGSPTFKDRYVDTVIARLFFEKPMNAVERMTMDEFRRCDVAGMLRKVESLESCLSIDMPGPFSYKDFYVIYCKFWELDRNRDMMLTVADLKAYESQALTVPAVARIMRGHGQLVSVGRPGKANPALDKMRSDGQMNFSQFVRFILATEDKSTAHALRFWFDVLDLDSDAVLTPHELLQFWEPQSRKLDTLLRSFLRAPSPPIRPANVSPRLTPSGLPGALAMPDTYFSRDDVVCVVLDLVKPGEDGSVVLRMSDWVRDRVASAMVVDLLVDARRHLERVRKGTDGRFRRRDEVWGVGGQGNRVKLEGWNKYCERSYRELAGHAFTQSSTSR